MEEIETLVANKFYSYIFKPNFVLEMMSIMIYIFKSFLKNDQIEKSNSAPFNNYGSFSSFLFLHLISEKFYLGVIMQ